MAYAKLLGINPVYGLYPGMAAPIVASLTTGTILMVSTLTSAIAISTGSVIQQAGIDVAAHPSALFTITFLVGAVMFLMGLLRLGVVATMTTVGYGDKAPRTVGGRVVALVWMFTSIILFAFITAAVTASLTVGTLSGKVQGLNDLYGVRVGSVARSESLGYLVQHGIGVRAFKSQQDGLQAMIDGEIDAFVFNARTLENAARAGFYGRIQVLPEIFDRYYVSMAMAPGSTLREPFNQALLTIIETEEWLRLTAHYIGSEKCARWRRGVRVYLLVTKELREVLRGG